MNNQVDIYRGIDRRAGPPMVIAHQAAPPRDIIDMRSWLTILRRRLGLFVGVLCAALVLAALISWTQVPIYSAVAQVAMNARDNPLTPDQSAQASGTTPTDALVDTQVQEIGSQIMARRVATALNLADDPMFNPLLQPPVSRWSRINLLFGARPGPIPPSDRSLREQVAVNTLMGSISAFRIAQTYALGIRVQARDPVVAARIANEYARQFTGGGLDAKSQRNRAQAEVLREKLHGLEGNANAEVARMQQYRSANKMPSTTGATLTEQEISAYNQNVAAARAQLAEDEARLSTARAQLRTGSTGGDVGEALGSGVVAGLRGRQAETSAQVANLTARYGPEHPDLIKAKSELAELDRQIQGEIGRIISNLEARVRVSQQRVGAISGSLATAQGRLEQNSNALVGLGILQRKADSSNALYSSYLDTYRQAVAREGAEQPDSRILTLAEPRFGPDSPNIPLNLALGLVIGLGLGLAAAFIAELVFPGVTTSNEVEERLGIPYLGSIPQLSSVDGGSGSPMTAVVERPRSAFAEAFRSLKTALDFSTQGPVHVVAITSALPSEGKTTIAVCLARSVGLTGESVVLIDTDLRRRGVSRYILSGADRPGLIEVLNGSCSLDQALLRDDRSGAFFLPVLSASEEQSELLTGEAMDRLLVLLRERFQYIIIDTAPLLPIAAARVLAGKADAALMVMRWRHTADHAVKAALKLVPASRGTVSGIVLSRVNMKRQSRYGYGDAAFYYHKYKGYYA